MASRTAAATNNETVSLLPSEPPFYSSLHVQYITSLAAKLDLSTSYEGALTEHRKLFRCILNH